ncbi:MAG: tetratricopeptide repeat protein, partial [Elusimicrobiota bacterium]|nr:tetratricopeptide repeat protein [Elusimicrobiota bacterium]
MLKKLFIFVQMSVVLNFVGCATTSKITDLNNTISADNVRIARELFISGEKQVKSNQQKAIECFTKAIESNPNYAEAYNSRGSVYLDLKQNETALNDFCTAIKIDPKLADAYNNRGTVYYQKKMFNKAIRDYTKAIEINPQFADAYYNRGLAYIDTDKFKKAKKDLLGVLILNGENETMVSKCIASLNLIGRNTYPIVSLSEIPDYYIFVSVENSGENIWIP